MTTTTHMTITLVEQSQAQKEVTVNAALVRIDALMNTGAKSRSTSTPPGASAATSPRPQGRRGAARRPWRAPRRCALPILPASRSRRPG